MKQETLIPKDIPKGAVEVNYWKSSKEKSYSLWTRIKIMLHRVQIEQNPSCKSHWYSLVVMNGKIHVLREWDFIS